MSATLVPLNIPHSLVALVSKAPTVFLPNAKGAERFIEFFAANIRNRNTRRAYYKAVCRFSAWCEGRGLHDLGLADFHAAVLRLPGVQGVLANTDLAGHIFGLPSGFHLFGCPNDLRFRMLASRHPAPLPNSMKSYSTSCGFRGAGHLKALSAAYA